MSFYDEKNDDIELNITPLIDVVFILLIFFMVSTIFVSKTGFKLQLPKANAKQIEKNNDNIEISISKKGKIAFNGEKIQNSTDLIKILKTNLKTKLIDKTTITLKADKHTYYGLVIDVMDKIKSIGINKIIIATQK